MSVRIIDIITALILHFVYCACSEHILSCNVTQLNSCPGDFQVCNETSHQCYCLDGYIADGVECLRKSEIINTSNHDATAAVVSIFTIALVIVGLVLVVKRYNLIEYIHHKVNFRRNNDVLYEDVMIGHDDPPLVP